MSKTKLLVGAGAALAFTLSTISPAYAQVNPNSPGIDPHEPHIMVAKSDFGGLRAARQGDNDVRGFSMSQYQAYIQQHGIEDPGNREFNSMLLENRSACEQTGDWIRESIDIQNEAARLGLKTVEIRQELIGLGRDLRTAAVIRTGGNAFGTAALCALSAGWYCAAAVLVALGNEAMGQAHTKQAKINRRQSINSADLTILNTRAMVLHTKMNIGWAVMVSGYCRTYHVDAYIGKTSYNSTSSVTTAATNDNAPSTPAYPQSKRLPQRNVW